MIDGVAQHPGRFGLGGGQIALFGMQPGERQAGRRIQRFQLGGERQRLACEVWVVALCQHRRTPRRQGRARPAFQRGCMERLGGLREFTIFAHISMPYGSFLNSHKP